jgi:hypothetical protein
MEEIGLGRGDNEYRTEIWDLDSQQLAAQER